MTARIVNGVRVNHPDDFHKIDGQGRFGKLRILCTQKEAVQRHRSLYASSQLDQQSGNYIKAGDQPALLCKSSSVNAYKSNDWGTIKSLQDQANSDLQAIMTNFSNHVDDSWVQVQDDTDSYIYYMSWDNNGNYAWVFCAAVTPAPFDPNNPDVKLLAPSQFGIFSKTTSICGIHSYNLGLVTMISETVASLIVGIFLNKAIKAGINFLAEDLISYVSDAATEAGVELLFSAGGFALGALCSCVVFAIVFIGIAFLWNFLNKQFQICLSVYNWDEKNDWQIPTQALSNGVNPGETQGNTLNINIKKKIPKGTNPFGGGGVQVPGDIGNQLMHTTEEAMNYAYIVYENKTTFMQGCSFAFKSTCNNDSNTGFTYAMQCPFSANNGQVATNTPQDPNTFLTWAQYNFVATKGPYTVTVNNKPISGYIDALKGGDAQGSTDYSVAVHINPPNNQ